MASIQRFVTQTIANLGRPWLFYLVLTNLAARLAPPGKTRRRLARKLNCKAAMVPDALVHYAAIYALVGLIVLLCLRGLVIIGGS